MANEKTPVVWDDTAKKHRPLGSGEKMGGLSASSMISADSGNLLQQGSDGLMLVTGSSLADPRADNLLEESDNGKLQVTSDRVVEWLEGHPQAAAAIAEAVKVVSGDSGNVITAGADKGAFMSKATLAGAVSTMSAAQLTTLANALRKAGGGLNIDPSTGKLVVDFGSMDPAIMRSVVLSMVQQGGGIGVDSNGQLFVDFDSMPTDKFEAMLKSLKMLVPLDRNMNVYVDLNSDGDTLVDGRGTQAKPFKHIQNAITYITGSYSLGRFNAFIHIKAGQYSEHLTLPVYSSGGGAIYIRTWSGQRDVTVSNSTVGSLVSASNGGTWRISDISFMHYCLAPKSVYVDTAISVSNGSSLQLSGCTYTNVFPADFDNSGLYYEFRMFNVDNATMQWYFSYNNPQAITCADHASATTSVFAVARGGQLIIAGYQGTDTVYPVTQCSGTIDTFAVVSSNSHISRVGGGDWCRFTGSVTGRRYRVTGGSSILVPPVVGADIEEYFPGTVAGTVDDGTDGRPQTYCWYNS